MVDRIPFSEIEGLPLELRRLKPVELLGIDNSFNNWLNPVGIFRVPNVGKPVLIAVVEFDDLFDLSGYRFYND
jgi:hypothetical protein